MSNCLAVPLCCAAPAKSPASRAAKTAAISVSIGPGVWERAAMAKAASNRTRGTRMVRHDGSQPRSFFNWLNLPARPLSARGTAVTHGRQSGPLFADAPGILQNTHCTFRPEHGPRSLQNLFNCLKPLQQLLRQLGDDVLFRIHDLRDIVANTAAQDDSDLGGIECVALRKVSRKPGGRALQGLPQGIRH